MREDLPDIVRECGRTRRPSHKTRKWSPPYRYALEDDGSPTRVPMKPRRGDLKCSNMRYNPLTRALKSYVGKPWSEAYSALTSIFRRPTVTTLWAIGHAQYLIRSGDHVLWEPNLFVDAGGILRERPPVSRRRKHDINCWCGHCNKNPLTGMDMSGTEWRLIDKTHFAEKEQGIWYVYTVGWHDPDEIISSNTFAGELVIVRYRDRPKEPLWYIADKRQASRKMLRHLGVRNDHPLTIHA